MKVLRFGLLCLLIVLVWPEYAHYRSQWRLAEANARMERVLSGRERSQNAVSSVQKAVVLAQQVREQNPDDPNAILIEGIGLMMLGHGQDAVRSFERAIAQGERPEFVVNLGRARASVGDMPGADQAYLHAAWSSANSIATLPKAMREDLLKEVELLERDLMERNLTSPPELR